MKKKKFNSFCIICKTPANAPAGFSNVNKVTLCRSKKCRRFRKTCLQREHRRQLSFKLDIERTPLMAAKCQRGRNTRLKLDVKHTFAQADKEMRELIANTDGSRTHRKAKK